MHGTDSGNIVKLRHRFVMSPMIGFVDLSNKFDLFDYCLHNLLRVVQLARVFVGR